MTLFRIWFDWRVNVLGAMNILVVCRLLNIPVDWRVNVLGAMIYLLFVGYLIFQQHASVSRGRICSHNFICCCTEIEVAVPNFLSHPVILTLGQPDPALPL